MVNPSWQARNQAEDLKSLEQGVGIYGRYEEDGELYEWGVRDYEDKVFACKR
jgi:hypothetical protein